MACMHLLCCLILGFGRFSHLGSIFSLLFIDAKQGYFIDRQINKSVFAIQKPYICCITYLVLLNLYSTIIFAEKKLWIVQDVEA